MALFDEYDAIIQKHKVNCTLNLADLQILSKHIFYVKIKSFYTLYKHLSRVSPVASTRKDGGHVVVSSGIAEIVSMLISEQEA